MKQAALPLDGWCCGPLFQPVVKRRTPQWLTADDWATIRALYREAARLTRETGELHVVDHIVPKIGGIVTGLHVPWNLQVMHWRDNSRKGAARWPDMPEVQDELFGEKR